MISDKEDFSYARFHTLFWTTCKLTFLEQKRFLFCVFFLCVIKKSLAVLAKTKLLYFRPKALWKPITLKEKHLFFHIFSWNKLFCAGHPVCHHPTDPDVFLTLLSLLLHPNRLALTDCICNFSVGPVPQEGWAVKSESRRNQDIPPQVLPWCQLQPSPTTAPHQEAHLVCLQLSLEVRTISSSWHFSPRGGSYFLLSLVSRTLPIRCVNRSFIKFSLKSQQSISSVSH